MLKDKVVLDPGANRRLRSVLTDTEFCSLTLMEKKKAARVYSMEEWGTSKEIANVASSISDDRFSFTIVNMIIMGSGAALA